MKLIAMMVVSNEADRYLSPCIENLLGFCDEIRVLDDGSTDGTMEVLGAYESVETIRNDYPTFFEHEGRARQQLLEWTMAGDPTHVLAIDADEFVADGEILRMALAEDSFTGVVKLAMTEIWGADSNWLQVRMDGAWKPRPIGIAFRVPPDHHSNRQYRRHWRIPDRALACGRVPMMTAMQANRTITEAVTDILHFGWANVDDRAARYARYVEHDGGQFHASAHLESIMWGDDRVQTKPMRWPVTFEQKSAVYARATL